MFVRRTHFHLVIISSPLSQPTHLLYPSQDIPRRKGLVQGSNTLVRLLGIGLLSWVLLHLLIVQRHLILLGGAISATVPEGIIVQTAKAVCIIPVDTCHSKMRSLSGLTHWMELAVLL